MSDPLLSPVLERIRHAAAHSRPLAIHGHGSKYFYGHTEQGERLETAALTGISSYEPSELVITARGGTPLSEIEAALARREQCLAFEPPRFGGRGTVGGMVAAGLSGPSRAAVGAVRDFVLGATLVNGKGEVLSFGGQVMKNVAGYDVSRMLAGSMGTLGLIAEVSLKVLPVAPATATLRFEMEEAAALQRLNEWAGQPLPLNASAWWDGMLAVRLRGAQAAVQSAVQRLGGELIHAHSAAPFWEDLRDHTDEFFNRARQAIAKEESGQRLWRLGVPSTAPVIDLSGETLIEWGGAQRWLLTNLDAAKVRAAVARLGGHATLFYALDKADGVFEPLSAPLQRIHRQLKKAFDPSGVFNPGRLYPDL
jgi:glycolate oxidase FAD binding subunit